MARLDKERQAELEPKRMAYAIERIKEKGFDVEQFSETELRFLYRGSIVAFFPYSGWASGATIKDGRGLKKLLMQLNNK